MLNLKEKQGYKFTEEFGNIPNDWGYDRLYKYCSIGTGNGNTQDSEKDGIYPFYVRSPIIERSNKYIFDGEAVLTVGDGVGTGKVFHYINGKFNFHQRVYKMSDFKGLNGKFFYYFFSTYFGNRVNQMTAKSSVDSVRLEMISNMKILLPSTLEQEKIAEVLSDIDELIESTQKLIDKKKDIKTAAMQKLFTPKLHWKKEIFGCLGTTYSGLSGKTKEDFEKGNAFYITFLNVMNNVSINTNIFETVCINSFESQCLCKKNDLFFNTSSETPEEVGMCSVLLKEIENLYLNSFCFGFRLKKQSGVYPLYLSYWFRSKIGRELMSQLAQGSTRYNLSKDNFMKSEIQLPEYEEQVKSANLLFDMDSEIETLEKELKKSKDLKAGMMQQLLTGKIRLISKDVKADNKVVDIASVNLTRMANDEFKDAVIISMLAYKFGSSKYPLGAFRRQKLSYLFKRHNNIAIDEYEKKAMGPYNSKIKYRGGEGIAIRNKYVKKVGERGLVSDKDILKAEEYFNKYYTQESLSWLESNFKYTKNNDLEVLATVDYAIVGLKNQNIPITLENIKSYINNDEDWKPKLQKDFFNDNAILNAMNKSKTLLNSY